MNRKILFSIILTLIAFFSFSQEEKKAVVDYNADISTIVNQGEKVELVGNVVFYHNGAFITCDTAYRYSEQHMEGVGNVIINSDSTFVYGDRFIYNGETNIAEVFAPIIKTIDKDVILYTHNMEFNTLDNTGTYSGGGTATQGNNSMESEKGIYYSATREVLLLNSVEMENENYRIATDSIKYNFNNEVVTFLAKTNIWNHNGEFLIANRGNYDTRNEVYDFFDNAYILTKEQEVWADSIIYKSTEATAQLHRDIQILDTLQRVLSFGDRGYYWKNSKRVLMTQEPSVITYPEEGTDSTYLRADTILVVPILDPLKSHHSLIEDAKNGTMTDSLAGEGVHQHFDSISSNPSFIDSLANRGEVILDSLLIDSTLVEIDSLAADSLTTKEPLPELSKRELRKLAKIKKDEEKRLEKERKAKQKAQEREEKYNSIVNGDKYDLLHNRFLKGGKHDHDHDHEGHEGHDHHDEEFSEGDLDSLTLDSLASDSLASDTLKKEVVLTPDSSDYYIYAFNGVKSYNVDVQMSSDSLKANSLYERSTLFRKGLIWNQNNQISADSIKFYTKNSEADRIEFYEFPIMAQSLRENRFNQVRGKYMEAFFLNNEIDVLYVDGNSECAYFREEEGDGHISALINVVSANMVFYFDSTQISDIKWFNNIEFKVYPIEKLGEEAKVTLEGFKWQEDMRPKNREEVTERAVKPSQRSEAEAIEQPQFGITKEIDEEKIKFTEMGIWRDRNEPLPVDKSEFNNRIL